MKTLGCAIVALIASVIYSQIAWNVISAPSITGQDVAMAIAYGMGAGLAIGGLVMAIQGTEPRRVQVYVRTVVKPRDSSPHTQVREESNTLKRHDLISKWQWLQGNYGKGDLE